MLTTRTITYTYDPLGRLTGAEYSTGESFAYHLDAAGNRQVMTSTTPLSGTLVTTYGYDAANRLTDRAVSDGRVYTYTWSARGQLLAEWTQGYPVRAFEYDGAGRLVEARVFTQTTRFTYSGLGGRVAVEVVGQGTTTVTLDYAAGNRILAEETLAGTIQYLYGPDCIGELRDGEWLYYLGDGDGLVRQGADGEGNVTADWLFDPDGTVLEGPEGPVSHLVCGGVYDWSTGLIYKNHNYFDPRLGIWLALAPLVVVQSWRGRKRRGGPPWYGLLVVIVAVGMSGTLSGCGNEPTAMPTACIETTGPIVSPTITVNPTWTPVLMPESPIATPESTDTPVPEPTPDANLFRITNDEVDAAGGMFNYLQTESEALLLARLAMGEGADSNADDQKFVMWTVKARTIIGVSSKRQYHPTTIKAEILHPDQYCAITSLIAVQYPENLGDDGSNIKRMGYPRDADLSQFNMRVYGSDGTICQELREIYHMIDNEEAKLKVRVAMSMARKMVNKLREYREKNQTV